MNLVASLARLVDAIEEAPAFPFGADLGNARAALDHGLLGSDEAAVHLRTLLDGARDTPGFPFHDDVAMAERDLAAFADLDHGVARSTPHSVGGRR